MRAALVAIAMALAFTSVRAEEPPALVTSPIETERVTVLPSGDYKVLWGGRRQLVHSYRATPHKEFYYEIQYDAATGEIFCLHIPEAIGG